MLTKGEQTNKSTMFTIGPFTEKVSWSLDVTLLSSGQLAPLLTWASQSICYLDTEQFTWFLYFWHRPLVSYSPTSCSFIWEAAGRHQALFFAGLWMALTLILTVHHSTGQRCVHRVPSFPLLHPYQNLSSQQCSSSGNFNGALKSLVTLSSKSFHCLACFQANVTIGFRFHWLSSSWMLYSCCTMWSWRHSFVTVISFVTIIFYRFTRSLKNSRPNLNLHWTQCQKSSHSRRHMGCFVPFVRTKLDWTGPGPMIKQRELKHGFLSFSSKIVGQDETFSRKYKLRRTKNKKGDKGGHGLAPWFKNRKQMKPGTQLWKGRKLKLRDWWRSAHHTTVP